MTEPINVYLFKSDCNRQDKIRELLRERETSINTLLLIHWDTAF